MDVSESTVNIDLVHKELGIQRPTTMCAKRAPRRKNVRLLSESLNDLVIAARRWLAATAAVYNSRHSGQSGSRSVVSRVKKN